MTPTPVARIRYQLANDSRSGAEVARTRRVSSTALATSMPDRATSGPTARPVKRAMKSAHPQQTAVSRPNRTELIVSLQVLPSAGPGLLPDQSGPLSPLFQPNLLDRHEQAGYGQRTPQRTINGRLRAW